MFLLDRCKESFSVKLLLDVLPYILSMVSFTATTTAVSENYQ